MFALLSGVAVDPREGKVMPDTGTTTPTRTTMARKKKGAGSLYRPTYPAPAQTYAQAKAAGTLRQSPTWWCKYYVDGLPHRESTGTERETEGRRFLNARLGRVADHQPILPRVDRIEYEEARADLVAYYKTTGKRDLVEAGSRLAHLDKFFTRAWLVSIGAADVTRYSEARQAEGAENATINREISVLSKMLKVAYKNNKLTRLPLFEKLKENPPREGFFEREEFDNVRKRLHDDLQVAVTLYHTLGVAPRRGVARGAPSTRPRCRDAQAGPRPDEERRRPDHLPHGRTQGAPRGPGGARQGAGAAGRAHHPVARPAPAPR
ncbi:MAG: hypothetical protein ACHQ8D_05165 [Candidatus Rokuibacteriota bacterium]